jgi:hypothetical protein
MAHLQNWRIWAPWSTPPTGRPKRGPMIATTPSTSLVSVPPMFTNAELLALARLLAGYHGLTRATLPAGCAQSPGSNLDCQARCTCRRRLSLEQLLVRPTYPRSHRLVGAPTYVNDVGYMEANRTIVIRGDAGRVSFVTEVPSYGRPTPLGVQRVPSSGRSNG